MYVSSEVRRRELPESSPDSNPYAAAASGSSFMAILSEMSSPPAESPEAPLTEAVKDISNATDAPETDAPGSTTPTGKTSETGEVTEQAPTEEKPETPTVEATSSSAEKDQVAAAETAAPEVPETGATGVSANTPTPTGSVTIDETGGEPPSDAAADTTGTDPLIEAASPASPRIASTASLEVAATAAEGTDSTSEPVAATPVENFPKTLNALIAEGVLRKSEDSADEIESVAPEELELPDSVQETPIDLPVPELPESPPQPQMAAMETGGVRPQATGLPRLPMANLPGELAQQIHLMQQEGARTMRLTLVPENLGELRVEIQGTADTLRVKLVTANPAVRDALESQIGALKDALQRQGLALDNATVDSGTTRRDTTPDQNSRPTTTTYRATTRTLALSGANVPAPTPIALGSSALNILA